MLALAALVGWRAHDEMGQGRLMAKYATPRYVSMKPEELAASSLSREDLAKSVVAAQETAMGMATQWQQTNEHDNRILQGVLVILGVYALIVFSYLWRVPNNSGRHE